MWRGGACNMGLLLTPLILLGMALALPSQDKPAPRSNCIRMTLEKERQIDLIVEQLGNFLNNLTIEHEHFDIRLIKLSIEQHTEDEVEEKETVLQLAVNDCELSSDELEEIEHHREQVTQQEKEIEAKEADKLKQEQQIEENAKITDADEQKEEHATIPDADEQKSETSQNEQETQENGENSDAQPTKEEMSTSEQGTQTNDELSDVHEQRETENLKNYEEIMENNENSVANENADETSNDEHENEDTDDKPETNNQTEADTLKNDAEETETGKNFEVMYLDLDENGQKLVEAMGKKKKGPRIVYVQERINSGLTEYWFLKRR